MLVINDINKINFWKSASVDLDVTKKGSNNFAKKKQLSLQNKLFLQSVGHKLRK